MPPPRPAGSGAPQPAFAAANSSTARARGDWSSRRGGIRADPASRLRELVDEALDDEDVVRGPDAAPEAVDRLHGPTFHAHVRQG